MAQLAFYSLCDWHPSAGPEDEWLAAWAQAGWVPEWLPPYEGVWCLVGGVERKRYSMVRAGTWADRYAAERPDNEHRSARSVPVSTQRA